MSSGKAVYLDSSAIVKLVVIEPETVALTKFVKRADSLVSCSIAKVETLRAVQRHGPESTKQAERVLDLIQLIKVDDELLDEAVAMPPEALRTLDALHLAAASALEDMLETVVTYDDRMAAGCKLLRLPVSAP